MYHLITTQFLGGAVFNVANLTSVDSEPEAIRGTRGFPSGREELTGKQTGLDETRSGAPTWWNDIYIETGFLGKSRTLCMSVIYHLFVGIVSWGVQESQWRPVPKV